MIMSIILPYIKIIRLPNALMAGAAVFLGFWLSDSGFSLMRLIFLILAATASISFGNVVNDIKDIASDKISHPERPLPRGEMSLRSALIFSILLASLALFLSFKVTLLHGIATLIPLSLLLVYAIYLKGTPITGNILVALLVAYPLIYGSLGSNQAKNVFIPAILAFLLNFSREIIKDLQDEKGDSAVGYGTSAHLPPNLLKFTLFTNSIIYVGLIFLPVLFHYFGTVYAVVCCVGALPIHIYRSILLVKSSWLSKLSQISRLYKVEMLVGLLALALDKLYHQFI